MKRILTKKRFVMLAFLLGMTAFGFGITSLSAQVSDNTQWKSSVDAIAVLNQEMNVLDNDLQANPNNDLLMYKRKFYYVISTSIEEGQAVASALNYGYATFVPQTGSSPYSVDPIANPLPVSTWNTFYQDAVQLLTL